TFTDYLLQQSPYGGQQASTAGTSTGQKRRARDDLRAVRAMRNWHRTGQRRPLSGRFPCVVSWNRPCRKGDQGMRRALSGFFVLALVSAAHAADPTEATLRQPAALSTPEFLLQAAAIRKFAT